MGVREKKTTTVLWWGGGRKSTSLFFFGGGGENKKNLLTTLFGEKIKNLFLSEKYIPLNRNTIGTACQPLWHMRLKLRAVAWGCIGHVICALLVDWLAGSCYAI